MNERIKELHKQAFDWVQYQLQTVGSDHPVTQKEQLDMVNQKFAELIVRECMRMCEVTEMSFVTHGCDVEASGAITVKQFIEEHFGVEE